MHIKLTSSTLLSFFIIAIAAQFQGCASVQSSTQTTPTFTVLDLDKSSPGSPPESWRQILPSTSKSYTNYEVRDGREGRFLYMQSGGADSWLELDVNSMDPHDYPLMLLTWMANQLPATEWEENAGQNDFACRIEFIYDYTHNSFNPLYIARKGLINRFILGNPPEMIISYVWSKNLPPNDRFTSPEGDNIIVIPLESELSPLNTWIETSHDIAADFDRLIDNRNIVLKKIRIRCDTGDTGSTASCAIKSLILSTD